MFDGFLEYGDLACARRLTSTLRRGDAAEEGEDTRGLGLVRRKSKAGCLRRSRGAVPFIMLRLSD